MAMRSVVSRSPLRRFMENTTPSSSVFPRYMSSDGKGGGRIFSEEERAQETVYIKKMERERLEKLKKQVAEKDKAAAASTDKDDHASSDKKSQG